MVPAAQGWGRVHGTAMPPDLEVKVAADGAGVAGLSHRADALAGEDASAPPDDRGTPQVGIEVAAALAGAVDEDEVAVQDRVETGASHAAAAHGEQPRATGSDYVEPLMRPPAAARRPELPNRPPSPVLPDHGEDMAHEPRPARGAGKAGRRESQQRRCNPHDQKSGLKLETTRARKRRLCLPRECPKKQFPQGGPAACGLIGSRAAARNV